MQAWGPDTALYKNLPFYTEVFWVDKVTWVYPRVNLIVRWLYYQGDLCAEVDCISGTTSRLPDSALVNICCWNVNVWEKSLFLWQHFSFEDMRSCVKPWCWCIDIKSLASTGSWLSLLGIQIMLYLQEADNWTTLSAHVDVVFESQDVHLNNNNNNNN